MRSVNIRVCVHEECASTRVCVHEECVYTNVSS